MSESSCSFCRRNNILNNFLISLDIKSLKTMKRLALSIVISILFISSGCDIIEEPYINSGVENPDNGETVQKILLEEFTGHQCPNCPEGAEIIKQLKNLYGNRLIVVAYHTGFFARTSTGFTTDYRTAVGSELDTYYGIQAYPSGLVNRSNNEVLGRFAWATASAQVAEVTPTLDINITHEYNSTNRSLSVTINSTAIEPQSRINICVFITESGIISPQLTSDGIIHDYEHNHVFRLSLNGTWGTSIFEEGAIANQSQSITFNGSIDPLWVDNNIDIICFAYDSETEEVIQAEIKSLL